MTQHVMHYLFCIDDVHEKVTLNLFSVCSSFPIICELEFLLNTCSLVQRRTFLVW